MDMECVLKVQKEDEERWYTTSNTVSYRIFAGGGGTLYVVLGGGHA